MCGFIGCFHELGTHTESQFQDLFKNMNHIIHHRGPDDAGYFHDDHVSFGFRRLSIIDIENGHQPLSYENERYWIIFNGEIYNHVELRDQLVEKGYHFATHSDTEVIIALYSIYKEQTPDKLRGMFAFLIWDKQEKSLFGARDRFGIKPFFYMESDDHTYFASEKKSILLALKNDVINPESLQHYLTYQYVPEPETMSDGIKKLLPGHYFTKKENEKVVMNQYWKPTFSPVKSSEEKLVHDIRDALYDSVHVHMRSDVPVGSFLSGGIDSSLIVSIAKEFHPNIKTFSVGFEHGGYSEIDVAKETADKLDLENISYVISPEEYIKELPKIVWHLDDPLADPAAIPLYFVAREASKHVKVVLSGEGADELFGGYNIYREPQDLAMFNKVPKSLKAALKKLSQLVPEGVKGKSFIERGCTPMEDRYIGNAKMFDEQEKSTIYTWYNQDIHYLDLTKTFYQETKDYEAVNRMQYIDMHTWLRGDILLKADKMTMAHSLELRVPFLDKEVFKVAATIGTEYKTTNNTTKYILRQAAKGIVPDHVLNRRKLGFPVPIRHWLKNEMHDWALTTIKESQTSHLINKEAVIKLLEEHCKGKLDNSRKIWTVLIFMIWHQVFIENKYNFQSIEKKEFV